MGDERDEIRMMPQRRERSEISIIILLIPRRAKESRRLRRKRHRSYQITWFGGRDGSPGWRDGEERQAEGGGLDFAHVDGEEGVRRAEEGYDIRPPRDGGELDGGAGGVDSAEGGEGCSGAAVGLREEGLGVLLLEEGEVFGGGAEVGYGEGVDEVGHGHFGGGAEGGAVVDDDGGADGEGGDEPVPHHPGGGGVVEEAGGGAEVAVDYVLFFVLNERAEGGVHDALWWAGGAGGVEDVEGVGGREGGECERGVWVGDTGCHLGLNLHQPLQHRMHPRIGTHARPHNTNTRRRQRRNNRISCVPEEPRDAVPWAQREVLEGENAAADALAELGPAYGVRGGFVGFDDGG
ncbi:hypothetical protein V500_10201, partial [Pseudogymnoascus sp. VKM F-4518 (FW-2643)]